MKIYFGLLFILINHTVIAQLGFCTGDKGDPVFVENFGTLNSGADPNAIGTTTYTYVPNGRPPDGSFTISNKFDWFPSWFDTVDHTKGDENGNALIVNADDTAAGRFFSREISGLCAGTTYEFSAWVINISSSIKGAFCEQLTGIPGGIPINLSFEIWDVTDTILLKSGTTGQINAVDTPTWTQYGLTFQTVAGQEDIILKILNNGVGGCGNDLAIDDIQFASCGDITLITNNAGLSSPAQYCGAGGPGSIQLTATPDFSVFSAHFYQWQQSNNGISYTDIIGENRNIYTTPNLTAVGNYYYRVKIAENNVNLMNPFCSSASKEFLVQIAETPSSPTKNNIDDFCEGDTVIVSVTNLQPNTTVHWYDSAQGGILIDTGLSYNAGELSPNTYTFYTETVLDAFECTSSPRIPVTAVVSALPVVKSDEKIIICKGARVELDSEIIGVTYLWNTSDTSKTINVSEEGNFVVTVTNPLGCEAILNFEVSFETIPEIKEISSDQDQVTIIVENEGNFEYSIDNGITFQNSPVFNLVPTKTYTAVVRDLMGCNLTDTQLFFHLNIPRFFTPNNDSFNDRFLVEGIKNVQIYDRYGKLLLFRVGKIDWDGFVKGKPMPTDDYWYLITTPSGDKVTGHVTLKR